MKVRMVDVTSEYYHVAHRYMIRIKKEDFVDSHELAKYAATANSSLEEFKKQFQYLVEEESEELEGKSEAIVLEAEDSIPEKKPTKSKK